MIPPRAVRDRGGDGDATLALLLHPIHRGCAIVDFPHAPLDAGVEQNPLGDGSFTGIDMRKNSQIAKDSWIHDLVGPYSCAFPCSQADAQ